VPRLDEDEVAAVLEHVEAVQNWAAFRRGPSASRVPGRGCLPLRVRARACSELAS
jgi:hypothetical protein